VKTEIALALQVYMSFVSLVVEHLLIQHMFFLTKMPTLLLIGEEDYIMLKNAKPVDSATQMTLFLQF
jgi:hypothetical protein